VTLRKMRRDGVPLPFSAEADAAAPSTRLPARLARQLARRASRPDVSPAAGVLHHLLGDYSI